MIIPGLNLQHCYSPNFISMQISTAPPPFSPAIVRDREILISAPFTCKPLQYINSEASLFLQETGWLTLLGGGWGGGHPFCPKIILFYKPTQPLKPQGQCFPPSANELPVTVSMVTTYVAIFFSGTGVFHAESKNSKGLSLRCIVKKWRNPSFKGRFGKNHFFPGFLKSKPSGFLFFWKQG